MANNLGMTSGFFNTTEADNSLSSRGAPSVYNQWSDQTPQNYAQYMAKFNAGKGDVNNPLANWLSAGATPYTEAEYNAKNQQAAVSPTSFGGGSSNLGMGSGYQATNAAPQATAQGGGVSPSPSQGATQSGGSNPYLQDMGQNIMSQMTDNYNRNQLPAMRSGAMAAGGFGGSRQGVVEANGLKDLNLGIGQNLTNLYGTDWTNQQNRDLSYAGLDSNNQQFGANYGLNVLNSQNNWANNGVTAANSMAATPTNYNNMFNNNQNAIAGQGGTTSQNNQGNPWLGALGGFQIANQYLK